MKKFLSVILAGTLLLTTLGTKVSASSIKNFNNSKGNAITTNVNYPRVIVDPIDHSDYTIYVNGARDIINYNSAFVSGGVAALAGYQLSKIIKQNFYGSIATSVLSGIFGYLVDSALSRPDRAIETTIYRKATPNANGLYDYVVYVFEYENNYYWNNMIGYYTYHIYNAV